jgi:(3,5-dihydroxyphenyl)acetyl-CoA 1,2-dioxygenase
MVTAQVGLLDTLDAAGLTAETLYDELTDGRSRSIRVAELVYLAADRVPGLVPTRAEMDAEAKLTLPAKTGLEISQGLLLSEWLANPRTGTHLVESMLEPTGLALEHLDEYRRTGTADFGKVKLVRHGLAATLELSNPRHLNAEDRSTLAATEAAVDLVMLDPNTDIGVFRGGLIDHERYRNVRVFGAGINLTHLYQGRIDYLFYIERDAGFVNKVYRGVRWEGQIHEKPWIGVVERFAVGGACQLMLTMDHVIGTRGSLINLPARKEGIIPGVANLRLPRFVGDRAARQAILSGREWIVGEPDTDALVDEPVDERDVESVLAARIDALTNSGVVSVVANRRVMRIGQEPQDVFRQYMAEYARAQAHCHLSPALISNLEKNWDAANRSI